MYMKHVLHSNDTGVRIDDIGTALHTQEKERPVEGTNLLKLDYGHIQR